MFKLFRLKSKLKDAGHTATSPRESSSSAPSNNEVIVAHLKSVFKKFDTDNSDSITEEKLASILIQLDLAEDSKEAVAIASSMPLKKDGKISLDEFLNWHFVNHSDVYTSIKKNRFRRKNSSVMTTISEVESVFTLGSECEVHFHHQKQWIKGKIVEVDKNGAGKFISFDKERRKWVHLFGSDNIRKIKDSKSSHMNDKNVNLNEKKNEVVEEETVFLASDKKNKDPNPTVQEQTVSLPSDKRAERVVVEEKTAKFPSEGVGIHFKNRDKFQMKNLNRELSSLTTEEQLINKDLNKDDENEKNGNNRKDNAQDSNHRADIVFRRLDRKRKNKICLGDILQAFRTDRVAAKLIGLAHKVQDNQQIHEEKKLVEAFQKVGVKEPSDMVNREKFRVAVDLLCFTSQHSSQQSPSANVEEKK